MFQCAVNCLRDRRGRRTGRRAWLGRAAIALAGLLLLTRAAAAAGGWGPAVAVGGLTDAAAIVGGHPAKAWGGEDGVHFARAGDAFGTAWAAPVLAAPAAPCPSGAWCARTHLTVLDLGGRPAIVFTEVVQDPSSGASYSLRFVRAVDDAGSTWNPPITISDRTSSFYSAHAAVVAGRPAVVIGDDFDLLYARADDAEGSSWPAPALLYSGSPSGDPSEGPLTLEARLVAGPSGPAISFITFLFGWGTTGLSYLRATDAAGNAWAAPVAVFTQPSRGAAFHQALAFVDGRPAVAFSEGSSDGIRFFHAADADGSTWAAPVIVATKPENQQIRWSLAVVDGHAAVAIQRVDLLGIAVSALEYLRAADAEGSSWGLPETVVASEIEGILLEAAGRPAIAYGGSYIRLNTDLSDLDSDGISDALDNCPSAANPDQADKDGDGLGNACDADDDNDGVLDGSDNCPLEINPDQGDADGDGQGNPCDLVYDNTPPVAGDIVVVGSGIVPVGSTVSASVAFTDINHDDAYTVTWNWGDGPDWGGDINSSTRVASGSHLYSTPGVYTVRATLSDYRGASDQAAFDFIVVYDPNGSSVRGNGEILSPAGACSLTPACATATGPASFGFASKYRSGKTTPDGHTRFVFRAGNLTFVANAFDWLVVGGAKAQFKGSGQINNSGAYGFMLTAVDANLTAPTADLDTFRIKVWDLATGVVVYDNNRSAADSADPTTALTRGKIEIVR